MENENATTVDMNKVRLNQNPVDMAKMFDGIENASKPDFNTQEYDQVFVQVILVSKDGKNLQVAGRIYADGLNAETLGMVLGHANRTAKESYLKTGVEMGRKDSASLMEFLVGYLSTANAEPERGFEVEADLREKGVDEPLQ